MTTPERVSVTGSLTADAVEGGIPHLETATGGRYQVIWPAGWQLHRTDFTLRDPAGRVVARGGDRITVRGVLSERLSSVRQAGRMIQADSVTTGEPGRAPGEGNP